MNTTNTRGIGNGSTSSLNQKPLSEAERAERTERQLAAMAKRNAELGIDPSSAGA